eukprot:gene36138-43831_t
MASSKLFLDWRHISEDQLKQLENTLDVQQIKLSLLRIFNFEHYDKHQQSIAVNLFMRVYAFCKNTAFNWHKTSTLLSIIYEVFQRDARLSSAENDMQKSFAFFEDLLIKHSVHSPPKSIKVFERIDVDCIMEYILERYYRHFKVYSYIFATQSILSFEQRDRNEVDAPHQPPPLAEAWQFS